MRGLVSDMILPRRAQFGRRSREIVDARRRSRRFLQGFVVFIIHGLVEDEIDFLPPWHGVVKLGLVET